MSYYRYVKSYPRIRVKIPVVYSVGTMLTGCIMILWALWPIYRFQYLSPTYFSTVISPIQNYSVPGVNGPVYAADNTETGTDELIDLDKWYPDNPQSSDASVVTEYTLAIPKLHISDARVIIGGDSLEESLIHYGGTGIPGLTGTSVIFGHSTLPQLFDATNYKTIFSYLPTLKPKSDTYQGDEIFITYDSVTYRYVVEDMKVLDPDDLSVLDQKYDASYVTLVTCVPPGTLWKRLKVSAKVAPNI